MAYFNELPNLEVVSRFPNQSSNQDYTTIKNLWKRPKLREDIANAITAFNYYQIKDGERPDQIAEKVYGDPELDWVILITNNITNFNEEWPLENNIFYNYLIDKYGSEEALQEIHHTETTKQTDQFNRVVISEGLQIDSTIQIPSEFQTQEFSNTYTLDSFIFIDETKVKVNLIQALNVDKRIEGDELYFIPDIKVEFSYLKVFTRNSGTLDVEINNDIQNTWPSGWGGKLTVYKRSGELLIEIEDVVNNNYEVILPKKLYEIIGQLNENGEIIPTITFTYGTTT